MSSSSSSSVSRKGDRVAMCRFATVIGPLKDNERSHRNLEAADRKLSLAFVYGEAFGTAGKGSPASRFFTSLARKSAKGAISSPTLAFSRAFT